MSVNDELTVMLVESDLGGGIDGASYGGSQLLNLLERDVVIDNIVSSKALCKSSSETPFAHFLEQINTCLQEVSDNTRDLLLKHSDKKPLLFSGDHSTAAGTISGIKQAYPEHRIGASIRKING
ncbi:MAG: arginase family protein [Pseudomonadales bacterium]|nr:arginase family protein [Pseudomonadales bacterium]